METCSSLLVLCAGNSPVHGELPSQRPVTRCFDIFFDLRLNKQLNKQSRGWWFETLWRSLWRHCNAGEWVADTLVIVGIALCGYSSKPVTRKPFASHDVMVRMDWQHRSWWRHQIDTFSALLAICAGNTQRPVTRSFFMSSLICTWINGWGNNREAGDLKRHRPHYDVRVMLPASCRIFLRVQTIVF